MNDTTFGVLRLTLRADAYDWRFLAGRRLELLGPRLGPLPLRPDQLPACALRRPREAGVPPKSR